MLIVVDSRMKGLMCPIAEATREHAARVEVKEGIALKGGDERRKKGGLKEGKGLLSKRRTKEESEGRKR